MRLQFSGEYQLPLKQPPAVRFGKVDKTDRKVEIVNENNYSGNIGGPEEIYEIKITKSKVTGHVSTIGQIDIGNESTITGKVNALEDLSLWGNSTIHGDVSVNGRCNLMSSTIDGTLTFRSRKHEQNEKSHRFNNVVLNNVVVEPPTDGSQPTLVLTGGNTAINGTITFVGGTPGDVILKNGAKLRGDQVKNGTLVCQR